MAKKGRGKVYRPALIFTMWLVAFPGMWASGWCSGQPDSVDGWHAEAEQESLGVYKLDEVLVTASRLPARGALFLSDVAVSTKDDISELGSSTVVEPLVLDSGVNLTRYGGYGSLQTLSLRGGGSNEVVYLLDGVPISL